MIAYRQRGFGNLYALFVTSASVALMPLYASVLPLLHLDGIVEFNHNANIPPYVLTVLIGMMASNGYIREHSAALHSMGWGGAIALAARQTLYVTACIFMLKGVARELLVSRGFLISYLALNGVMLIWLHGRAPRALTKMLFPETARMPTLFVGRVASLENLDAWITNRGHLGIQPVGFVSNETPTRAEKLVAPYLGQIDRMREIIQEKGIVQVVLLEWLHDPVEVERMVETCESEGCRFLFYNNYGARFARQFIPVEEGGEHFLSLQAEPLEDPLNRGVKRLLDLAVSLPVVVLLLPFMCALVAVMQRIQAPGPLFFVRPRGGRNRREFRMLKFRSMYAAGHDPAGEATQARQGDSRIFHFGQFMRRSSLDEFPQFINVLLGEMSVVGPRPHLPQHDDEFSQIARAYRTRSLVKPGLTGLAQVNGFRGEITDPEKLHRRVYWDLYYLTHWSLWLDVRLILRTAWQVMFPPAEAY